MNKTDLTPKKYFLQAAHPINNTHLLKCEKEDYYKLFFAIRIPELQYANFIGIVHRSIFDRIWEEARNYK
jgi:hypothetical protein